MDDFWDCDVICFNLLRKKGTLPESNFILSRLSYPGSKGFFFPSTRELDQPKKTKPWPHVNSWEPLIVDCFAEQSNCRYIHHKSYEKPPQPDQHPNINPHVKTWKNQLNGPNESMRHELSNPKFLGYPLVNIQKTMERSTIFLNRWINYVYEPCSKATLNYIPDGI